MLLDITVHNLKNHFTRWIVSSKVSVVLSIVNSAAVRCVALGLEEQLQLVNIYIVEQHIINMRLGNT